ncbi:uncharacterized protein TNCV_2816641 [Trichonephila clavipes]|nr:uncharacterized protein TNCV_2816641 [Trichonephila clavipes]
MRIPTACLEICLNCLIQSASDRKTDCATRQRQEKVCHLVNSSTRRSRRWFAVREILYKGTLTRNPWCSRHRRIDEADISTLVAVDQCAANYLEEAVRSFPVIPSRCRSSRADITFRRPLPVFRIVRWSTASKLASLWNCSAAHELLLHDRKIPILEGR